MPSFSYVAMDRRGAETKGALTVGNLAEALRAIRDMGYYPTKVVADDTGRPSSRSSEVGRRPKRRAWSVPARRVKIRSLVVFTRQVATLLEAGMPLLRGLRLIREQEGSAPLRRVIENISESIENGASVSEAMALHPRVFSGLYLHMVRAGEISGALEVVLRRLAELLEKAQKLRRKVVAAMFYPSVVLLVAVGVLGVLMTVVVPRFKEIFDGLTNRPMPAFTQFVLDLSTGVRDHVVLLLMAALGAVLGFITFGRTRLGREVIDRMMLNLPLFGELVRKTAVVRFTRTLGTLTSNGVPILQALQIVKDTAGNAVIGRAVQDVHDSVAEGETISLPLRASGVFPALVVGMIDIGEQTGALPEMLSKIADTYEDEVDTTVAALMSMLEPIMIVLLAVVVGSIVVALFLPIVDAALHADGSGAKSGE